MITQDKKLLLEQNFSESWAWQGNTFTIHKLVKKNDKVDRKLQVIVDQFKGNIIENIKDVYILSFVHPDIEYAVSMVSNLSPRGKTWFAYTDPERMMINKRLSTSGISLEKLTAPKFKTTFFLSAGYECEFKLLEKIQCESISTTIPIPLGAIFGIYENYKIKFEKRSKLLKTHGFKFSKFKAVSLPQLFTKSNYVFVYNKQPY